MKTVFFLLISSCLLLSCKDPMELKSPVNSQLDREIADRITRLGADTSDSSRLDDIRLKELLKIDKDLNELMSHINLFDVATKNAAAADEYFVKLAVVPADETPEFIKISSVDEKPEMILAIKLNELTFLDRLLFFRSKSRMALQH